MFGILDVFLVSLITMYYVVNNNLISLCIISCIYDLFYYTSNGIN